MVLAIVGLCHPYRQRHLSKCHPPVGLHHGGLVEDQKLLLPVEPIAGWLLAHLSFHHGGLYLRLLLVEPCGLYLRLLE